MRLSGVVDSARNVIPHGHLCWAYQDRSDFRARALEFIAGGISAGQWVEYVGSGSVEALCDELTGLDGIQDIVINNSGLGVSSVSEFYRFYRHKVVVDPIGAVAARVAAARAALAAGYTGFRAVVDATDVVRSPEQREAFACFEHLIDRQMSILPVSALCAYNVRELGSAAVAELACLHPLITAGSTSFRLHADKDIDFALAGDIDISFADLFSTTLRRTMPLSSGSELVIDGCGLEFIDHRGLLALDRHAWEHDRNVVLRSNSSTVNRIAELLPLKALRVEMVA